jgi:hypothetical protein
MLSELTKKDVNTEFIAEKALGDEDLLSALREGILSKTDTVRENSFKALLLISKAHPEVLYPHWDYFANLLDSTNSYTVYIGMYIIAHLAKVDTKNRFDKVFDRYYSIFGGKQTMTAAHAAKLSGKIATYKPALQGKITEKLLSIDEIHKGSQKELIKGYVIEAFNEYFGEAEDKEDILEFVRGQLQSTSPKTRKTAEEFLKKWS